MSPVTKVVDQWGTPYELLATRRAAGFVPTLLKSEEPETLTGVAPPAMARTGQWRGEGWQTTRDPHCTNDRRKA